MELIEENENINEIDEIETSLADSGDFDNYLIHKAKIIDFNESPPKKGKWQLGPLLRDNSNGSSQNIWTIYFDGIDKLFTLYGQVGSELAPQMAEIDIEPKAGRTMLEQALSEARSRYLEKYDKKNYRTIGELSEVEFKGPMLCQTYEEGKIKNFPVAVQPKLNGIRYLSVLKQGKVEGLSRNKKKVNNMIYINKELEIFLTFLPPQTRTDGEIFNPNLSFTEISRAYRSGTDKAGNIVEEKLGKNLKKLHYYMYDLILTDNIPFEQRSEILTVAIASYRKANPDSKYLKMVNFQEVNSNEEIEEKLEEYVNKKFEGVIIRKITAPRVKTVDTLYKSGRSTRIFKYKSFTDEEGVVIDIKGGSGREKNAAILKLRDTTGSELWIRPAETIAVREEWLADPTEVLGKKYTFKFQERSDKGVCTITKGIALRDYE